MSQKFNAKNLAYDAKLPPFLAALRAQNATSAAGGPDPLRAANRRHDKGRSGSEEAEDAPLVVDEGGNVVEGRVGGDGNLIYEGGEGEGEGAEGEGQGEEKGDKEKPVSIGKKRKARVVGAGQEDESEAPKSGRVDRKSKDEDKPKGSEPKPPAKKKKAKKIKLSFDDQDT